MKTKMNFIPGLLILFSVVFFAGCNDDEDDPQVDEKNIVEVAADAGNFSTLIEAAQKTGLANFLSNQNGLTVFAPTDDAFTALLSDLGVSGLDDIDNATLETILKYHVIGGVAYSINLTTAYYPTLASFNDNNITMFISLEDGATINKEISITTVDIEASNGVIHVVDKVILPPSVVDIAVANDGFSILVEAVVKAGLAETLSGNGPFTVFAPTNAAFEALFAQLGVSGIDDLTAEQLIPILTYHVVSGNVLSTDLAPGEVETLSDGKTIDVNLADGVRINESSVVAADIQGANGVVHVIDQVLIPE